MSNQSLHSHPAFLRDNAHRRREINWGLLLGTAILLAFLLPGASYFHDWQLKRNARSLLETALTLEKEGNVREAVRMAEMYIDLAGPTVENYQRVVDLMEKFPDPRVADYQKLSLYHSKILDLKPSLSGNRRKLAELLSGLGSHERATEEAKTLLTENGNDIVAQRVLADALVARKQYAQAQAPYLRIIKQSPNDLLAYVYLAACHLQLGETAQALSVMDQMVAANPHSAEAYFRRYWYRRGLSKEDPKDLAKAVELDPKNVAYMVAAADQAMSEKKYEQAKEQYRKAIELAKDSPSTLAMAYLGLGNAFEKAGDPSGAINVWLKGLEETSPTDFTLNGRIIEVLLAERRLDEIPGRIQRMRQRFRAVLAQSRQKSSELASLQQVIDWLEARYFLAKGDLASAMPLLQGASSSDLGDPAVTFAALETLGRLYAAQKKWDAAAQSFQRAVRIRAESIPTRMAWGEALARAGRTDQAIAVYSELSRSPNAPPEVWPALAKLNLLVQSTRPQDGRTWTTFQRSLEESRRRGADPVEVTLLEASRLASDRKYADATRALAVAELATALRTPRDLATRAIGRLLASFDEVRKKGSLAVAAGAWKGPWLSPKLTLDLSRLIGGHAELLEAQGYDAQARGLLRAGMRLLPGSAFLATVLGAMEIRQGRPAESIQTVHAALGGAEPSDKLALLRIKLAAQRRLEDFVAAVETVQQLLAISPENIDLLAELADLQVRAGKGEDVEATVARIRQIEGEEGTQWRFAQAAYLLQRRSTPEQSDLDAADHLAADILARRPTWARAHVLAGRIALARGQLDRATDEYRRAVEHGETRLEVYERLVELLAARGEHAEADQVISRLRESSLADPGMLPLALEMISRNRNFAEGESLARRAVEDRPNDPRGYVWLGQMQMLADKPAEARANFDKAIKLDPKGFEPRLALLRFLVAEKKTAEAESLVRELEKGEVVLPKPDLALGYAWSLVGNVETAKKYYQQAMAKYPGDQGVLSSAAKFFLQNGLREAEPALRELQKVRPDDASVRRAMAVHLYTRDDAQSWRTAVELLADQSSPADLRLKAQILEKLGGPDNITAAIRILEQLVAKPDQVTPEDRYRLALLYERTGKLDGAIDHMLGVVFDRKATPVQLATCVGLLLRAGRWRGETQSLLERLEKLEPDSFRTIALRARWLRDAGRSAEALKVVEDHLASTVGKPTYTPTLGSAARVLSQLAFQEQAEKLWREYAKREPTGYKQLVAYLVERGRADEGLRICLAEAASPDDKKRMAALALATQYSSAGSPKMQEQVRTMLEAARRKDPGSPTILKAVAERDLRDGRYEEAVALYRQCLAAEPRNVVLLNNLAIALSKAGRHAEALAEIDRAIELIGPHVELLDTKGVVLMESGDVAGAINLLFKVAADGSASAVHHLHLAYAYSKANRPIESRYQLDKAKEKNIDAQLISEGDRRMWAAMSGVEN